MSFGSAADIRITWHQSDGIHAYSKYDRLQSKTCAAESSFTSCVTRSHNCRVKILFYNSAHLDLTLLSCTEPFKNACDDIVLHSLPGDDSQCFIGVLQVNGEKVFRHSFFNAFFHHTE